MSKTEEKTLYPIYCSATELGGLCTIISQHQDNFPAIWEQLMGYWRRFHEEARVNITKCGGNRIKITDKDGNTIIREKYPWE